MNNKILVELCCGSLDDAIEAKRGGADRIELNSCMFQGGLTPSLGTLLECKEALNIPVITMVRPRGGGFCYTQNEAKTMYRDARELLKHGADGIVFGFLDKNGNIDTERCKRILDIIEGSTSVFHRAIDVTPNPIKALDILIELGVTRVLTSGQRPYAIDGAPLIKQLIKHAQGRIEILACATIRAEHIPEFVRLTGCEQVHFSHTTERGDESTRANPSIHFNAPVFLPEDTFSITDGDGVANIIRAVNN